MNCDITKELTEYGVEYHVLQEEILAPRPETKRIKELEAQNELLNQQVTALNQQLQVSLPNKFESVLIELNREYAIEIPILSISSKRFLEGEKRKGVRHVTTRFPVTDASDARPKPSNCVATRG